MRQIVALLLGFFLLAIALMTGVFLFIALAAAVTVFMIYLFVRQKITGESPNVIRFYTFEKRSSHREDTPTETRVIEAEYEEIDGDRR